MTITPPAGATITKQPAAGATGEVIIKGLAIPPGVTKNITFANPNGSINYKITSYDYLGADGKERWVGSCGDPIAFHVATGGPGGDNYLGYPIPSGHYGYFYQMYATATTGTTVLRAHINLGAGSGAYNFQVLNNSFRHMPDPGFDLEDIAVPPIDPPDGYVYEVLVPYMDPADATGVPGVPTGWSFNSATGIASMDFTGAGGLTVGQTGSIVAFTSPYPPTVTEDNVNVDYLDGVEPPCTGTVAADALVPSSPTPPEFVFAALPEHPGGASTAFTITCRDFICSPGEHCCSAAGQSLDGDGIWKAVVWSNPSGVSWQIETLPNPFGNTESVAFAASRYFKGTIFYSIGGGSANTPGRVCVGGPNAGNPCTTNANCFPGGTCPLGPDPRPQPVFWVRENEGPWAVVVPPLPPGFNSGAFLAADTGDTPDTDTVHFSGWLSQNEGAERHAVYCDMTTDGGGWTAIWTFLPDNGPGFPSEALSITHDNIFIDDVHIGGASATPISPMAPTVWQSLPGGGFERIELSMAPGAYLGAITATEVHNDGEIFAVGHIASPGGIDFYRGAVWRVSFPASAPVQLPPLPDMRDSRATGVFFIDASLDADIVFHEYAHGLSYVELSPGSERATLWEIAPDDTIITYDLNERTVNLPAGVTLNTATASTTPNLGVTDIRFSVSGTFTNSDSPSTPHAFVLSPPPPPDPLKTIQPTMVDFGNPDVLPIPPGFFDPGSLPFDGLMFLTGGGENPENSAISTLVQRMSAVNCPGSIFPRPCDPIPIEIIALDLKSINPITVTNIDDTTSMWNVDVDLSDIAPQPFGQTFAMLTHDNGGTYDCLLPVVPKFTFTNVNNPADIRVLDYGDTENPPIQVQFSNVPWVVTLDPQLAASIVAPSNGNFVTGVLEQDPGNPATQIAVAATGNSSGGGVTHTVGPPPPPPPPDPHFTSQPTLVNFGSPETPPIPPDFFNPGSNPFTGIVVLEGAAQDSRDTLVQRSGQPDCSQGPVSNLLVRALSLNLQSVSPITVTNGFGEPESQWDVAVSLSETDCNKNGMDDTIDLYCTQPNGGTFDATIPIMPKMTFTRVDNPAEVRILDYCNTGDPAIRVQFTGVPWVRNLAPHLQGVVYAPSDGNFVPGVLEQNPGDPLSQVVVQVTGTSQGGGVTHTIGPPVGPRLIPAGEDCWVTECGTTNYDFSVTPIPIGFFDVESDDNTLPFAESVLMEGAAGTNEDTKVRRCSDVVFDTSLPTSVDVPIELVALNLRSCGPVAVQDCCKDAELWDVEVSLSANPPPPCAGFMTLTKTHDNGGTFVSQFPVQARFRFRRVSDGIIREFDTGMAGLPSENLISAEPFAFVQRLYEPDTAQACGVNFVPGVEEFVSASRLFNPQSQSQCCTPPTCHNPGPHYGGSEHCTRPGDCRRCKGSCCDPANGGCSFETEGTCSASGRNFKRIGDKCDDADGDGIPDILEAGVRYCCGLPADNCNVPTDPSNPDTDGDGMLDGAEWFGGTDPCDPCNPNPSSPSCSPLGSDCQPNGTLDICDIANGTSADCDGNIIPDECQPDCDLDACADACEIICGTQVDVNPQNGIPDDCEGGGPPTPIADPTGIDKTRFISFSVPAPAGPGTALRVRLVSLHHVVPPYSGGPTLPFTSFEGQVRWVGPPAQYVESSASGIPFYASQLQCTSHYQDWSTVGLLHVTGSAITPSSLYEVQNLAATCMGMEATCADVSAALARRTTRWGDVRTPYNPPDPSVQPDISDVSALVDKFRNAPGAPIKARGILAGQPGNTFGEVTPAVLSVDFGFSHISACVDAFRGVPYPYTISACP